MYLILKKIIQPCKLLLSCGELEPELLIINQFLVGEISKLLIALNVLTPCINRKVNTPSKETVMKPASFGLGFQAFKM